jgi:hypothetical protein
MCTVSISPSLPVWVCLCEFATGSWVPHHAKSYSVVC